MRSANLYRVLWGWVCGIALLSEALAHHSTSMYDYAKTVTLADGTVLTGAAADFTRGPPQP